MAPTHWQFYPKHRNPPNCWFSPKKLEQRYPSKWHKSENRFRTYEDPRQLTAPVPLPSITVAMNSIHNVLLERFSGDFRPRKPHKIITRKDLWECSTRCVFIDANLNYEKENKLQLIVDWQTKGKYTVHWPQTPEIVTLSRLKGSVLWTIVDAFRLTCNHASDRSRVSPSPPFKLSVPSPLSASSFYIIFSPGRIKLTNWNVEHSMTRHDIAPIIVKITDACLHHWRTLKCRIKESPW